ncbi:hypothetical protein ABZ173_10140 [Streptomyces rochei]|uniref:hypothetical protein n=1 Tax=Streptomyces rochei TaxID=1928 RepID=UPI0033AC7A94
MPAPQHMRLFGGPHDGRTYPVPENRKVARRIIVVGEPDPSQEALYEIRLSALEADRQEVIYDFVGTVLASME